MKLEEMQVGKEYWVVEGRALLKARLVTIRSAPISGAVKYDVILPGNRKATYGNASKFRGEVR